MAKQTINASVPTDVAEEMAEAQESSVPESMLTAFEGKIIDELRTYETNLQHLQMQRQQITQALDTNTQQILRTDEAISVLKRIMEG